jgi:hypothetical protein
MQGDPLTQDPNIPIHGDPLTWDPNIPIHGDPLTRDPKYMVIPLPGILTYTKCMLANTW